MLEMCFLVDVCCRVCGSALAPDSDVALTKMFFCSFLEATGDNEGTRFSHPGPKVGGGMGGVRQALPGGPDPTTLDQRRVPLLHQVGMQYQPPSLLQVRFPKHCHRDSPAHPVARFSIVAAWRRIIVTVPVLSRRRRVRIRIIDLQINIRSRLSFSSLLSVEGLAP